MLYVKIDTLGNLYKTVKVGNHTRTAIQVPHIEKYVYIDLHKHKVIEPDSDRVLKFIEETKHVVSLMAI